MYSENREGASRWIWNFDVDVFLSLKSYKNNNKSFWLFSKFIEILFALQLQRLFFKQKKWFYTLSDKPLFDCKRNWALFTGTKGLNNKAVLYTKKAFYTIASAEYTTQLTANEDKILKETPPPSRRFIPSFVALFNNNFQLSNIFLFIFHSKWFPRNSYKSGVPLAVFAFLVFTSNHSFAHVAATDGVAVSSVLNKIVSTHLPYFNNNFKH